MGPFYEGMELINLFAIFYCQNLKDKQQLLSAESFLKSNQCRNAYRYGTNLSLNSIYENQDNRLITYFFGDKLKIALFKFKIPYYYSLTLLKSIY